MLQKNAKKQQKSKRKQKKKKTTTTTTKNKNEEKCCLNKNATICCKCIGLNVCTDVYGCYCFKSKNGVTLAAHATCNTSTRTTITTIVRLHYIQYMPPPTLYFTSLKKKKH